MERFELSRGGFVRFSLDDIQAWGPAYEDSYVTLKNGKTFLLKGRNPLERFKRANL